MFLGVCFALIITSTLFPRGCDQLWITRPHEKLLWLAGR